MIATGSQNSTGRTISGLIGVLFASFGAWIIHMGLVGQTPAQSLSPRDVPSLLMFGGLFAWTGIVAVIRALCGSRMPRWADMVLLSLSMLFLAIPFILIGVFRSDQIRSSTSVNGMLVSESTGGRSGAIVFVGTGILLLLLIPLVIRKMLRRDRRASK